MIGDASGYKFDPANITVKQGDAVKFIMVSGGPHNVAFQGITDPAAKAQLDANMSGAKMGELSSPMLMQPNEAYTISFAKVPAGKYDFTCTPHAAMNMKGVDHGSVVRSACFTAARAGRMRNSTSAPFVVLVYDVHGVATNHTFTYPPHV